MTVVDMGLQHALDLNITCVLCSSDCLQVVTVLQTNEDVSSYWARDVVHRIRSMVVRFQSIQFTHVQRERNNIADYLAREA